MENDVVASEAQDQKVKTSSQALFFEKQKGEPELPSTEVEEGLGSSSDDVQLLAEREKKANQALDRLEGFALRLEQSKIAEYMDYLSNPRRLIRMNLLMGAARGFGFAVGLTVLSAVIIYFLQYLVKLNLPVISRFIAEIFVLVEQYLEYRP